LCSAALSAQEADDSPVIPSVSDTVTDYFTQQMSAFPQEKVYLQTDKNYYLSGEKIWFRAHLVDAVLHKQANASRYVYVELVSPFDSVVSRVKVRPDTLGLFYGSIAIDEGLVEGNFMLRAYTLYMKNSGEDYFYRKSLRIIDPMSVYFDINIDYTFNNDDILAAVRVKNKRTLTLFEPSEFKYKINRDSWRKADFDNDSIGHLKFKIRDRDKRRTLTLTFQYDNRVYTRYFAVPYPDDDFDVTFFPEGGHLIAGADNFVALKALGSNGLSEDVEVNVFDDSGTAILNSRTSINGMGAFQLTVQAGRKYYAECINSKNRTKRFDLPQAVNNYCGIKLKWAGDKLYASVVKSADYSRTGKLYMLAHIRGAVIYCQEWDSANDYVLFEKSMLPSGVCHFVLFDEAKNILGERLTFSYSPAEAGQIDFVADKDNYLKRQHVEAKIKLTDVNQTPLGGNLAIAVTDDNDVKPDSSYTILTALLLTSELKGHIENPAHYFRPGRSAQYISDLLMMTQGWRRYPIVDVVKGKITSPTLPLETTQTISGKVEGLFSALKEGFISIIAMNDSMIAPHVAQTGDKGRFVLDNIEYPEGTRFIVQAETKKGGTRVFLEMDKTEPFADITLQVPYKEAFEIDSMQNYIAKSEERYTSEHGMRIVNLAEVEVVAKYKPPESKSRFYSVISSSGGVITEKDIETRKIHDMRTLLMQIPGLMVSGSTLSVRGQGAPLIVIDDTPFEDYDVFSMPVEDVSDVFLIKDASAGAMFGTSGGNGALIISTKEGFDQTKVKRKSENISDFFVPLGYQQQVEFYSPRYDVDPDNRTPDLRTTIYWKPDVGVTETGEVSFDFFTADSETTYSVVIEGISEYGHIVRKVCKINRTLK
jgi:hypothetical protein